MAIIRCTNGHYFDDLKYLECPRCAMTSASFVASERPVARDVALPELAQETHRDTDDLDNSIVADQRTVGIFQMGDEINPVVGWLVCIDGKERGKDIRLHAGRCIIDGALRGNRSMRDDKLDHWKKHCSIVFEPHAKTFSLIPGSSENVTINSIPSHEKVQLNGDEIIVIDESTFVLVPFCHEGRSW